MKTKTCSRCEAEKPTSEFCKSSKLPDGLQAWCKKCVNEYKRKWRHERRTPREKDRLRRLRKNQDELVSQGLKECSRCGEIKPLGRFFPGEGTGNVRADCMRCCYKTAPPRKRKYSQQQLKARRAGRAVYYAVERELIERPDRCMYCNQKPMTILGEETVVQFHHTNGYDGNNVYIGIYLCPSCHTKIHAGEIKAKGTKWL